MSNETEELRQRLQNLETMLLQHQRSVPEAPPVNPYLTTRPAAVELQPYDGFYRVLPDARNDFFRSPLSETERRSFLSRCPSNNDRKYRPPSLQRSIQVGNLTRRFDNQMADLQYRLSGITRPIDLMAHNLAQGEAPTIEDAGKFIRTIHSLLSDVASHITQLRSDSICKDAGLPTVQLDTGSDEDDNDNLLDTTRILEQAKLAKALQDAQPKGRLSRKKKGKRYNSSSSQTANSDSAHTRGQSNDQVHISGTTTPRPTTPSAPRPSTSSSNNSRGFQRR
ncbi:unnamed protein product [Mucor hiemalis]